MPDRIMQHGQLIENTVRLLNPFQVHAIEDIQEDTH